MNVRTPLSGVGQSRALALLAVLVSLGTALQVMYHFIDVVGLPVRFLTVVALSLLAATWMARVLRPRLAIAVGVSLFVVGLWWYLTQLPGDPPLLALLADSLSMLGGRSLLRITNVRAWVLGVTPGPVFLTWYFALRRWYTPAVTVAGGTLAFFVLTGDADVVTTLSGVVAAAAALGIGDLERRDEPVARAETILVVVAAMIIVPSVVSVVPTAAGASGPLFPGLNQENTVESNMLAADEDVTIQGDIALSPAVRFTVTSDEPSYWRVGSYDRYTGDGWVRTGGTRDYQGGRLDPPPGPSRSVEQSYRVEGRSDVVPAAWKPTRVSGVDSARIRSDGSFEAGETLDSGDTYRVQSQVPSASAQQLQTAGTDYPDGFAEAYTQLPDSTPDRVAERTARLTANADTPYETARVVEQYLENNKNYSLDVDRPRGNVADAFLFEMDRGYCTYYATTMVTMLRTQDVPARFVVGYTPGQRVDEDRWVVRGLNAHAWVEVYFPDYGWVTFDPTPSGPREGVRQQRIETARANGVSSADTTESRARSEETSTPTRTPEPLTTTSGRNGSTAGRMDSRAPERVLRTERPSLGSRTPGVPSGIVTGAGAATGADSDIVPRMPTRQQFALGLVALVGAAVGVRRSGVGQRAYRAIWLYYQPRQAPAADVERAFQRLVYHLDQRYYRSRWEGETVRDYFDAIDASPDAHRVADIRERARYRGEVSEEDADEAVRLVDRIVRG